MMSTTLPYHCNILQVIPGISNTDSCLQAACIYNSSIIQYNGKENVCTVITCQYFNSGRGTQQTNDIDKGTSMSTLFLYLYRKKLLLP